MRNKYLLVICLACCVGSVWAASTTSHKPTTPIATSTVSATAPVASTTPSAADVFKQLGALVGEWEGKFENGRVHRVTYRLSARGYALVETWALGPTSESITIYHLDGDKLVADHYCPQGNSPRLELSGMVGDQLNFTFRDGTNLGIVGKSHQQHFWLQIKSAEEYMRGETYVPNGSTAAQIAEAKADGAVRYTRVKPIALESKESKASGSN
jgi:hypothetical protein